MPEFDQLFTKAKAICRSQVDVDEQSTPKALIVHANDLVPLCSMFHADPDCYFDQLSCVTGLDNGVEAGTMEVAYNLYSIPYNLHLMIKVIIPRDNPEVPTVSSIWRTADWHERETFDLFGIVFTGHPDLRRILLPADWEGFPLRKDYRHQDYYRGIRVEY